MSSIVYVYGSFYLFLDSPGVSDVSPATIELVEIPDPPVGPSGATVGGGSVLILDEESTVYNSMNPVDRYTVDKLTSFRMERESVSVRVKMKDDLASAATFRGGKMGIRISYNGTSFEPWQYFPIVCTNPNNHYHWDGSAPIFVDGWYFKCVHEDASGSLTPFFFLYGVNNPGGAVPSESFMFCANGGTAPGATGTGSPSAPDLVDSMRGYPASTFTADKFKGLSCTITPTSPAGVGPFQAQDMQITGKSIGTGSGDLEWDLQFTKIHTQCISDFNPMDILPDMFYYTFPEMPLMKYLGEAPGVTANYMSHNMNSYISGEVKWKGKQYDFKDHKGYQDQNWGAGGFPHPYVWMQANKFVDSASSPLHETSLVAVYSPGMPFDVPGYSGLQVIGSICFRHKGNTYRFFLQTGYNSDMISFFAWMGDLVMDVGSVTCEVTFQQGQNNPVVNMLQPETIPAQIGTFDERHYSNSRPIALPVGWHLAARNDNSWVPGYGDAIDITVTADPSTVMMLAAPYVLGGVSMIAGGVTKQTMHAKFEVTITPNGGTSETVYCNCGVSEFGD